MKVLAGATLLAMLSPVTPAVAQDDVLPPLPALTIEADAISVMGVSSGGYMATQLAVAWPALFHGLAVFSAGPWGCAQGELSQALGQCMTTRQGLPNLEALARRHARYQADGRVGDASSLAKQRVFVWHGGADSVVDPRLGEQLTAQYRDWLNDASTQLKSTTNPHAAHGWPVANAETSDTALADCHAGGRPYLLACDEDGAGEALTWLYGERMQPPDDEGNGRLMPFDQTPFYTGRRLADKGFVFVPTACEEGAPCALTVALHGCDMSAAQLGDTFAQHSGLNAWAADNRLVVLYPQAEPSLPNPQACWDWWGYDESSWQPDPPYDNRSGKQLQALKAMVEQVAGLAAPSP